MESLLKTFIIEKRPTPSMPSIDYDTRAAGAIERRDAAASAPMPVTDG
ncbi:MAG: hypothetical protein AB7O56_00045 [Bauldia sp.]